MSFFFFFTFFKILKIRRRWFESIDRHDRLLRSFERSRIVRISRSRHLAVKFQNKYSAMFRNDRFITLNNPRFYIRMEKLLQKGKQVEEVEEEGKKEIITNICGSSAAQFSLKSKIPIFLGTQLHQSNLRIIKIIVSLFKYAYIPAKTETHPTNRPTDQPMNPPDDNLTP